MTTLLSAPLLSFFSSPRPPLALHSFPTRRSSDLGRQVLSLRHDAHDGLRCLRVRRSGELDEPGPRVRRPARPRFVQRSEEHTSELQSRFDLVCRLLLEKKKRKPNTRWRGPALRW